MDTFYIVVLVTARDRQEAEKIGRRLLEEKLIACVNIVAGVHSLFWWQGNVDSSEEVLMVAKTRKECFANIAIVVKSLHSYTVPEIIALPVVAGADDYLDWINQSVKLA